MRSKARHSFETRVDYFIEDIELVDVLRKSILDDELTGSTPYLLTKVDAQQHPYLRRRTDSPGSRKNIINHLRSTVYGSFVKDVYEEITHYLRTILQQCLQSGFDSDRIIGEHVIKLDARTILQMGTWEAMCEYVMSLLFQAMENERSTRKLLQKMCSKLGLSVPKCLIDETIPYIEIRHFLVHDNGVTSDAFRQEHEAFNYSPDGRIRVDYQFTLDMRSKSFALVQAIDEGLIANNLLAEEYMQP